MLHLFYMDRKEHMRILRESGKSWREVGLVYGISFARARFVVLGLKANWRNSGRGHTRRKVRIRDKYQCQDCGDVRTEEMAKKTGKRLFDVHHLDGFCGKKSRGYDSIKDMNRLITLCHKCHFNREDHSFNKL